MLPEVFPLPPISGSVNNGDDTRGTRVGKGVLVNREGHVMRRIFNRRDMKMVGVLEGPHRPRKARVNDKLVHEMSFIHESDKAGSRPSSRSGF